jgi:proteasome lid subunit RPN8/RPN11
MRARRVDFGLRRDHLRRGQDSGGGPPRAPRETVGRHGARAVRRRVEVDEALAPVVIPGRILNELFAHALETLPEECCGLIVGDEREPFRSVVRCRNDMTQRHRGDPDRYPRDGREAFCMNEGEYQLVLEEAEAAEEHVTAVYHSHVGSGAYLSETDLQYAESREFPFQQADQIVVALFERRVTGVGIFKRMAVGRPFVGRRLESAGP